MTLPLTSTEAPPNSEPLVLWGSDRVLSPLFHFLFANHQVKNVSQVSLHETLVKLCALHSVSAPTTRFLKGDAAQLPVEAKGPCTDLLPCIRSSVLHDSPVRT